MRRFWLALYVGTAVAHIPFAIAAASLFARVGVPFAPLFAVGLAALLSLLLRGRVRRARDDQPLPRWRSLLVEEPYCAHWCANLVAAPLFVVGALALGAAAAFGAARTVSIGD